MAKKNKKTIAQYFTIENAKDSVSLVNTVALTTTENVFTKAFTILGKWQKAADETLKNGLEFSAKKQNLIFDTLEVSKEKTVKRFKKSTAYFNKK